jgi:hypothetical protein
MSHPEHARSWLDRLAYRPGDVTRVEVLGSSPSGAWTCRLDVGDEGLILKVVSAASPPYVLERGRREVLFYRHFSDIVPVRTPEIVASYGPASDGCALLLRVYDPPPAIAGWGQELYRTAATELAMLHASYWDSTDGLDGLGWLRQPHGDDPGPAISPAAALSSWRALWTQRRFATVFDPPAMRAIETGIDAVHHLRAIVRGLGLPPTLCHGDAHHENVLMDADGTWLWTDWQEVGVGCGPDDLSFFYQRATAAGGSPDLPGMLQAYRAELGRRCEASIELEQLKTAVAVREVVQRLIEWPGYLARASEAVVRRHVVRTLALLDDLKGL